MVSSLPAELRCEFRNGLAWVDQDQDKLKNTTLFEKQTSFESFVWIENVSFKKDDFLAQILGPYNLGFITEGCALQ